MMGWVVEFINRKHVCQFAVKRRRWRPRRCFEPTLARCIVVGIPDSQFTQPPSKAHRALNHAESWLPFTYKSNQIHSWWPAQGSPQIGWRCQRKVFFFFFLQTLSSAWGEPSRTRVMFAASEASPVCVMSFVFHNRENCDEWMCSVLFAKRKDHFWKMHIYWFIIAKSPVPCISSLNTLS